MIAGRKVLAAFVLLCASGLTASVHGESGPGYLDTGDRGAGDYGAGDHGAETPQVPGQTGAWTGDLDGMAERHLIRVLVTPSQTDFFYEGPRPRGLTYERLVAFEEFVRKRVPSQPVPLRFLYLPVARDQLLPMLNAGYGDLVADSLLVTPERQAEAAFSAPLFDRAQEVVVTGPAETGIRRLKDLSGKRIYVRRTNNHADSLRALNRSLERQGLAPARLVWMDDHLDDEDLLQMVDAGLLGTTVVQRRQAVFWAGMLEGLTVHDELALSRNGRIAWAVRRDSPQLLALVNGFVRQMRAGSFLGNVLIRRYLSDRRFVRTATGPAALEKLHDLQPVFERYGAAYGFDWLWLIAQGYQESRLEQGTRSGRGAVGVMQILPATARSKPIAISGIQQVEPNIHAGVKYMAFLRDSFFAGPELDEFNRMLFCLAAYNAGPERVAALRRRAAREGLDPDVWFGSVEYLAARRLGRETTRYVANVYIYYVAYRMILAQTEAERKAFEEQRLRAAAEQIDPPLARAD